MADERPAVAPEWATTADPGDRDSAPGGKINSGWIAGEAPPHNWFNFLLKNSADWDRYLDSVARSLSSLNWEHVIASGTDGVFTGGEPTGGGFDPITGYWLVAGKSDSCHISQDDARTFQEFNTGMASAILLRDCAVGGASSAVAAGSSATVYQRATILSGSWGTVALPGSPGAIHSVLYDPQNSRYIVLGAAGSDPYVATSDNSTGTAFTERTVPSAFDGAAFVSAAVSDGGVVVAGQAVANGGKIGYSPDGGLNWNVSTTTLVDGAYDVAWSSDTGLFAAVRTDNASANHTYTSADGDTWVLTFSGSIGFDQPLASFGRSVQFLRHAIVVGGRINNLPALGISEDLGSTWSTLPLDAIGGIDPQIVSSASGGKLVAITDIAHGYRSPRTKPG